MNKKNLFLILLSFFYLCVGAQSKDTIYTQNAGEIAILGKRVAYVYKGEQISEDKVEELKQRETFFYPLRFILIATEVEKRKKYDYVFYVYNTHQVRVPNDERKEEMLRIIK